MSLTSYRAAPPRVTVFVPRTTPSWRIEDTDRRPCGRLRVVKDCEWVFQNSPAARPGGVLLFHRLSESTIGAAWFHGRVRDGIGWVTGAMTTKP